MSSRLNLQWVQGELVPFLDLVYNVVTGYEPKKYEEWEAEIARAETRTNTIRNYDDNIINIDRIRLALNSSPNVDAEDIAQAGQVITDQELVLTMLVRHCVTHGPYPLISIGVQKNPEALREREKLRQAGQSLPDIVTVRAVRSGRGGNGGMANHANYARNNSGSFGRNQGLQNGYGANPYAMADTSQASYYPTANSAGFGPLPYQHLEQYKGGYPQEVYGSSAVGQLNASVNGSVRSSSYSPPALGGYKDGVPTMGYTGPVNGQTQPIAIKRSSPQVRLQSEAPEFVPGKKVHNTLYAPEFQPGAQEHFTLSMTSGQYS